MTAAVVVAVMGSLLGIMLWRALFVRPGGVFPILDDVPVVRAQALPPEKKIRPRLADAVHEARKRRGGPVGFMIDLADQVDMTAFVKLLDERGVREDRVSRRSAFLDAFRLLAEDRQKDLLATLEQMRVAGRIERVDTFKIVNRVAVVARDPAVVDELARRHDVAMLMESEAPPSWTLRKIEDSPPLPGDAPAIVDAPPPGVVLAPGALSAPVDMRCWAIRQMRAAEAWRQGLTGEGVVVGLLGTGVRGDHEQVKDNWRGAVDPSRAADSWYHPEDPDGAIPVDTDRHGTGVLTAAVGQNKPRSDGRAVEIGVAPGATWVAAVAHVAARINYVFFTAAAEWMVYRARPDVVIYAMTFSPDVADPMLERIFSAMKVTETVVVMAAGNSGPVRGRNYAPANLPSLQPFGVPAFSVGSVRRDLQVSRFSSRGPSAQDRTGQLPQVLAPGEDVTVAFPLTTDGLIRDFGTSFAVGYAAGAAAILRQALPHAPPNEIEHILKGSAHRVGEGRPNNEAGWGVIDVAAALKEIERRRTMAIPVRESGW